MKKTYLTICNLIGCLSVIALHCNGIVHSYADARYWKTSLIVEVGCYFAVPLFLMITGANLLNYSQKYNTITFFKKRLVKVLVPSLCCSVLVISFKMMLGEFQIEEWSVKGIMELVMYHQYEPVYYYIFVIIGLYLTLPLLTPLAEEKNRILLEYGIVALFITSSLIPSIIKIWEWVPYNTSLNIQMGDYIVYILLGYYFSVTEVSNKIRNYICGCAIILVVFKYICTLYLSLLTEGYDKTLCGYVNVLTVIYTVAIFLFIKSIDFGKLEKSTLCMNIINTLSGYSFGVYLIHMMVIRIEKMVFDIDVLSIWWRTLGVLTTYISSIIILHSFYSIKSIVVKQIKQKKS